MGFPVFGLDEYGIEVLTVFLLLIPAAFYAMALWDDQKAKAALIAGLASHAISILHRWALLGRIPLSEKHDGLSFMAFAMSLLYAWLVLKRGLRGLGLWAVPAICLSVLVAAAHRTIDTISLFMQTSWFTLHVFFYFLSYAFIAISGCLGAHYLVTREQAYEFYQYRLMSLGWILLSASLFAGSVWFYLAYGTFWLWTSKELWIAVTWLYVGLYLHARLIRGLTGRPAAVMGVVALAVAFFTYFGVGTVIPSPPSQF